MLINGAPAGNLLHGIDLISVVGCNVGAIGGNRGNEIQHNGGAGVRVTNSGIRGTPPSQRVTIRGNAIYHNGDLGIDLRGDGVTINDPLDADTGSNGLQNFPQLLRVKPGTNASVQGELWSAANQSYTIDPLWLARHGLKRIWRRLDLSGFNDAHNQPTGLADFAVALINLDVRMRVTATATDAFGNTSEFSMALQNAAEGWACYP